MALEDALRDRRLTRRQVAILWLIRSIGGERRGLSRKQIQQAVTDWFEVSNSQITKALRAMARPPLGLVQIVEDPKSGARAGAAKRSRRETSPPNSRALIMNIKSIIQPRNKSVHVGGPLGGREAERSPARSAHTNERYFWPGTRFSRLPRAMRQDLRAQRLTSSI